MSEPPPDGGGGEQQHGPSSSNLLSTTRQGSVFRRALLSQTVADGTTLDRRSAVRVAC